MITWKIDSCNICGQVATYHRNQNEHSKLTMMSRTLSNGSQFHLHIACKEVIVESIYDHLGSELGEFTARKLGFLT